MFQKKKKNPDPETRDKTLVKKIVCSPIMASSPPQTRQTVLPMGELLYDGNILPHAGYQCTPGLM